MSQNINLYDPSLRTRRDVLAFSSALVLVGVAALGVGVAAALAKASVATIAPEALASNAELEAQQAAAQALAARVAARKPDGELQASIAAAQRALLQRRAALQRLDGGTPEQDDGFSRRLESLARQSVDGLWLTDMALRQDDVLLKGRALAPSLIPVYVQRLDRETSLQGRAFKALDVRRPLESMPPAGAAASAADGTVPPRHAEFVEFTLVGASHLEPAGGDREGRP